MKVSVDYASESLASPYGASVAAAQARAPQATSPDAESASATPTTSSTTKQPVGSFMTPIVRYDSAAEVTIIQYRDSATGELKRQVPTEKVVKTYREQHEQHEKIAKTALPSESGKASAKNEGSIAGQKNDQPHSAKDASASAPTHDVHSVKTVV